MDMRRDAEEIVEELTRGDDGDLEEGGGGNGAGNGGGNGGGSEEVLGAVGGGEQRPSIDTQNFEVIQQPRVVDETPTNGENLLIVEDKPVVDQPKVVDETPAPPKSEPTGKGGKDASPTTPKSSSSSTADSPASLIQVKLQIDASMDNDELEAVRQTMTFVLGFYRKWHEEHYHRADDKATAFVLGRTARAMDELPKEDQCLPEFHAKVEGVATMYASRLAQVAGQIEPQLLSKAAAAYRSWWTCLGGGAGGAQEQLVWTTFRQQADEIFKTGESWEKFTVVLLLAYLVCLSEPVRSGKLATGFLRSFIQYLVAERRVRWVSRHGGWSNAAWGLRRNRLARCLCAKSTMYGFVIVAIGAAAAGIFLTKKQQVR